MNEQTEKVGDDVIIRELRKEVEELRKDEARIMWFASRVADAEDMHPPSSLEAFRKAVDEAMAEEIEEASK